MGFFSEDEVSTPSQAESKEEAKPEVNESTEQLKATEVDPYEGKSPEELKRMLKESQTFIGRQAEEVGFSRKLLADHLARQQSEDGSRKRSDADQEIDPNVSIFADPVNAVKKQISEHPDVVEARQAAHELKAEKATEKVRKAVSDFESILNDPGFGTWLQENPFRKDTLIAANQSFNANAAIEVFNTFKMHKKLQEAEHGQKISEAKAKTQADKRSVMVDGGAPSREGEAKVYSRKELTQLALRDPKKYESLQDDITKAWLEGRVR